jgi:acetyl-CoA carboxylase biotin carboxyl carrier protein
VVKVTQADLEALVELFDASTWDELRLTLGGTEVFLAKDPAAAMPVPSAAALPAAALTAGPAVVAAPAAPALPRGEVAPAGWVVVRAPSLGTFYRAPKPGSPSYVEVGQAVTAETEVCLIEVMKLFTAVRAGIGGTVRRICVADGDLVEFDQTLFLIEPRG